MDTLIYSYDSDNVKQIDRIEFDIWSNENIKKNSILGNTSGVEVAELYDNSEPKIGSLIDPKFGTIRSDALCGTCGFNSTWCVGHFGHIELAEYIFNVNYLQYVHKIASCICLRCSKILIHNNENLMSDIMNNPVKDRLSLVKNATKNVTICQKANYGCGGQVPKIKMDPKKYGIINIYAETEIDGFKDENGTMIKKKLKQSLTPEVIYDIFKNISDEDCLLMGMEPSKMRPENMIHKNFPVPPIQMRPSVKGDFMGGSEMEDDLTKKLGDIVKANTRMINSRDNKHSIDNMHLLQSHCACYIEGGDTFCLGGADQKKKQIKSLSDRIKAKEGRIRSNLMGKRCDGTGRTVITSDPSIDNNSLGVPVKIAMTLTFPERVNKKNIVHLQMLVHNGSDKYPGANFVFKLNKNNDRLTLVCLKYNNNIELQEGDIVERHLINDDIVMLGRQPTLHKQSIMGHKIKVIDNHKLLTFRMSVAVTPPYNADFDGDEMNIFVPQSLQTQIELEEIAAVEKQLISPTHSKTCYGIVQDGLIGSYNLTSPTVKINWRTAMNLISYSTIEDFKFLKKDKQYEGTELFSLIIPPKITIKKEKLTVIKGNITKGRLSKDFLSAKKKNTLLQLIWDIYGATETKKFIDNTQRLINNYNLYRGFTVGYGDTVISDDVIEQISIIYNTKELKTERLITQVENNPTIMTADIFETKLLSEYSTISEDISKIVGETISKDNNFHIMWTSGSKGDQSNIGQMIGGLGVQIFEGQLIQKKYNNRTSPYYGKNDDRCFSRGMIRNPFMAGITFPNYVFHMLKKRAGSIDQQFKTADTGYSQRKLIKSMEDIMIKNDGTVRTANDTLLQLVYGNSGTDTTKQFEYEIKIIEMNNEELEKKYKFTKEELKQYNFTEKENNDYINNIFKIRDKIRLSVQKAQLDYILLPSAFMLPVNLNRIIDNVIENKTQKDKDTDKLEPIYIIEQMRRILSNKETHLICMSEKERNDKTSLKYRDEIAHKLTFKNAIYDCISPKRILIEYGLGKTDFDKIVNEIITSYNKNIIEPGEMVGVIAGQSMGEPLTQFTLNSFHHAGIASVSSTTQGVPRIRELLSVSKFPKTPQMVVYLTDEFKNNNEMSHKIASNIKYTTLGNITDDIKVYYDPKPKKAGGIMDKDNVVHTFYNTANKGSCTSDIVGLPWLLRIELSREKMLEKEVTLLEIKSKFCSWWEKKLLDDKTLKKEEKKVFTKITQIAILSNTDNNITPVIHVRFNARDNDKDKFNLETINNFIKYIIEKFKLKGINGVSNISAITEERNMIINSNGDLDKKKHFVIYTEGINMIDIRYLIGIDIYKTISNDVVKMYETFGIEIARGILQREIISAYVRAGGEVNQQHIMVIVDLMTSSGNISSADRYGMNKSDTEPLPRASFEKSVEQFVTASVFGEVDHMKGISSRIMTGGVVKGGTGYCNIVLNTEMIEKSINNNNDFDDVVEITSLNITNDVITQNNKHNIFMPI
jgi:DNA-directed RNA polymerase II subunit RPB1